MRSIREMMKIKLTILSPYYNITPLPFSLSFPTIVVVAQITVIKAKIKQQ